MPETPDFNNWEALSPSTKRVVKAWLWAGGISVVGVVLLWIF